VSSGRLPLAIARLTAAVKPAWMRPHASVSRRDAPVTVFRAGDDGHFPGDVVDEERHPRAERFQWRHRGDKMPFGCDELFDFAAVDSLNQVVARWEVSAKGGVSDTGPACDVVVTQKNACMSCRRSRDGSVYAQIVPTPLTFAVLDGHLRCKYLGLMRIAGQTGVSSEYMKLLEARGRSVQNTLLQKFGKHQTQSRVSVELSRAVLVLGEPLIVDALLIRDGINLCFPALLRTEGRSDLGNFHYIPMVFAAEPGTHKAERALLEVLAVLLSEVQVYEPRWGIICFGNSCRQKKVRLSADLRSGKRDLRAALRLCRGEDQPGLILNDHCGICEFAAQCREKAEREDNISLLSGIGRKAIAAYSKRGIVTLTQLAHTFRPRRKGKRGHGLNSTRYHALQALAIRDRRVYVLGTPTLPQGEIRIYLDLEGLPHEGFVYLIGMLVCDGSTELKYSFWADDIGEERIIFERFLDVVSRYEGAPIFVYGGYERAFLQRLRKHTRRKRLVDDALRRLVNVLGIIYSHFYFPTYGNGLKDIGRVLGCTWSEPSATGRQSLVWRAQWEVSRADSWKTKLATYNQEDCAALRVVFDFLGKPPASVQESLPTVKVEDLDRMVYAPKWGAMKFANDDFAVINSRAYFDYQQERVFVRTSKTLKKRLRRSGLHYNRRIRPNKRVDVAASRCPTCKSRDLEPLARGECKDMHFSRKRCLDLVITAGGIQRRVIECRSGVYRCKNCRRSFKPARYGRIAKHGHALMSWAMHAHIAHRLSYATIEELFREFFGLAVNNSEIHMFKGLLAAYYRKTYQNLIAKLVSGALLHVDETEVHLRSGKEYVWVFASIEDVVYIHRPSREGDFLKDMLSGFTGVLVSDFYAAYDGLNCPQQRCLIHLIRDLNQLLLGNPFDAEVQHITSSFGNLLRAIVGTIDEHGLKRCHLRQYEKDVRAFFDSLTDSSPESETARAIQDRLLRHREKLFTFIQHDGVPWNNNNAENAIKQFAYFREDRSAVMQSEGLRDYLVLLSICQTCRYKGLSFLKFLLSGEHDIDTFARNINLRRRRLLLPLYPKGFVPQIDRLKIAKRQQARGGKTGDSPAGGKKRS
jgi:predicted RecB family nuclease